MARSAADRGGLTGLAHLPRCSASGGSGIRRPIQGATQTGDQGEHRLMTAEIRAADLIQPLLGEILNVKVQVHTPGQGLQAPLTVRRIQRGSAWRRAGGTGDPIGRMWLP